MNRIVRFFALLIGMTVMSHAQSGSAGILTPDDSIIVPQNSIDSDDPYNIIWANIDFVNALFAEHIGKEEVSREALKSYYVDYYLAEVNNGGFSQFVYNSRWHPRTIGLVREGLVAMNANKHLALFEEGAALVAALGEAGLQRYLASDYFGGGRGTGQRLSAIDDRFFALKEQEDLIQLNSAWLKRHPKLVVIQKTEFSKEVARRVAAVPDRAGREKRALDAEPQYMKLIRLLCATTGQELKRVTSGDPSHKYQGKTGIAWNFITDKGRHYMVQANGKAIMFDGTSKARVAEVDIP